MITEKFTYQDIARQWRVSEDTVARWVAALEAAGLICPLRPTRRTVRLSAEDCQTLEQARKTAPLDGGGVRCPAKKPAKPDGKSRKVKNGVRRKNVQKRP